MQLPRPNLVQLALAWAALLICSALVLPPLDSHIQPRPAVMAVFLVCGTVLLCATFIAAVRYFTQSWGRVRQVPNRTAYVTWLIVESSAAVAVMLFLIYGLTRHH